MPRFVVMLALVLDAAATCWAMRAKDNWRVEEADVAEHTPGQPSRRPRRFGALAMSAATLAAVAQGSEALSPGMRRGGPIRMPRDEAREAKVVQPPALGYRPGARDEDLDIMRQIVQDYEAQEKKNKRHNRECPYGDHCVRPDCHLEHPEVKHWNPRKKNAQVVVMTESENGELSILLQRRGFHTNMAPGKISTIGGRREPEDRDSRDTAIRELWEETGLLDLGHLEGVPPELRRLAQSRRARRPLDLRIFARGKTSDWYVLVLDGTGTYMPAPHRDKCADMRDIAKDLGGVDAPAFGHAWVPLSSAVRLESWEGVAGLVSRIRQATFAYLRCDDPVKTPR